MVVVKGLQSPCWKSLPCLQWFDEVTTCDGTPETIVLPFTFRLVYLKWFWVASDLPLAPDRP